jgi:hypothetical protein
MEWASTVTWAFIIGMWLLILYKFIIALPKDIREFIIENFLK